jgi:PAS domain S-box-containing protein
MGYQDKTKEELLAEISDLHKTIDLITAKYEKQVQLNSFSEAKIAELKEKHGIERNLLNIFMNTTPDLVYFKDKESRFVRVSQAQAQRFGFDNASDLIGKTDFNLFTEEHARQAFQDEQVIMQTGEPIINLVEKETWANGISTWVSTTKVPLLDRDGQVIGTFGISRDISDQKLAEEALTISEEKFRTFFESMIEMVVLHELVFDVSGEPVNYRIIDCNKSFSEITGIEGDSAIGKLATEVFDLDEPPYFNHYSKIATEGGSRHFETYFEPLDRYFSISAVSLGHNKFATISTDISLIKKIQQKLAAKNKELEQIVYVASHDLRSPLVNVDGYSRELEYSINEMNTLLQKEADGDNELEDLLRQELPDMNSSLFYIRNSIRQMDLMLKGLLKYSRSGRAALSIGPVDMNGLIAQIAASLEFRLNQTGAELSVEELPPCKGDVMQLTQVFSNLMDNAIKYLDLNRSGKISVTGQVSFGRCIYCIEDNGIGIMEHQQEKIFELFQRLNPAEKEGEGLGLTIVRQALERLDGEVSVESVPGKGSRFFVTLPIT